MLRSTGGGLLLVTAAVAAMSAQTTPAASLKADNVRVGQIAALDASTGTITLTGARPPAAFRLTSRTVLMRGCRTVAADAFSAGQTVVVRFRKSAQPPQPLYDLVDRESWDWLLRVRRAITEVRVTRVGEDAIEGDEARKAVPVTYRVTPKTLCRLKGVDAEPAGLKIGDRVWVAPRLLPGGQAMAVAVADSEADAARLRERTMPSVTGTLTAFDAAARALTMSTRAGDRRDLTLADGCVVRRESREVGPSALRTGVAITAHLRRGDDGERRVVRVTVHAKAPSAPRAPSGAGKPGGAPRSPGGR